LKRPAPRQRGGTGKITRRRGVFSGG